MGAITKGRWPMILLILGAFLAPLTAGHVPTDMLPLSQGNSFIASLFMSQEAAVAGYLLPGLCVVFALFSALASRRVLQVPFPPFFIVSLVFGMAVVGSVAMSSFRSASLMWMSIWLVMIVAPFAAMAVLGRQEGPRWAMSALAGGATLAGVIGIIEYSQTKAVDPTWRIFGTFGNPNAFAGMLVIGMPLAMSLAARSERVLKLVWTAAAVLMGLALLLTQSKGGYLALAAGLAVLLVLAVAMMRTDGLKRIVPVALASLVFIGALGYALTRTPQSAANPGGPALNRVASANSTQEQSAGFRQNLWKSAIELTKMNPVGFGIGTFRYESTRPGIVPSTMLAHQSYLQMASETGVIGLLALLGVFGISIWEMLRGSKALEKDKLTLKVGVMSALAAAMAHNLVDSDLYTFGTGLSTFLLLGIGMQLANDAVTPEQFLRPVKGAGLAICGALALALTYFAVIDYMKAEGRGYAARRDFTSLKRTSDFLKQWAPNDPETYVLGFSTSQTVEDALNHLKRAAELGPTMRNLRNLGRFEERQGNFTAAQTAFSRALMRDPNNLPALRWMLEYNLKNQQLEEAKKVAERMIAVETSPAFTTRALPELVPTHTYFARYELSRLTSTPSKRIELLEPALKGLQEYRSRTVPLVQKMNEAEPGGTFGDESIDDAKQAMALGKQIALALADAYRTTGKLEGDPEVRAVSAAFADFDSTFRALSGSK
jgi:O-antigen ligase/tetratricopeptide (TPR) repeat protein